MKFIKKIKFKSFEDIKKALDKCFVLHAVPQIDIEPKSFYLECINYIGRPFYSEENLITKNKTGELWSEIKYDKEKASSFSYSNTRQPFHTDGAYESNSPDLSFFYCIKKADFGGATTFIDPKILIKCLSFYDKNLLEKIKNTKIDHFKGNDKKTAPILGENNDWNWNYFRANKNEVVEDFHNFLEEIVYKSSLYNSVLLNPNEALFFWDRKVLHGRNSFLGNRHLIKCGIFLD